MRWYLRTLEACVRRRGRTIAAGVLFFAVSVFGLMMIPKTFVPKSDIGTSQVQIELPPGVRLEQTAEVSKRVASILRAQPEVTNVVEWVGDEDQVRTAFQLVSLTPRGERPVSQMDWEDRMSAEFRKIPDARVQFNSTGGMGGRDITLYITGDDPQMLDTTSRRIVAEMRGLKEIRDPLIAGDMPRPELVIKPRLDLAAELGVTVQAISQTIRIATLGDIPQNGAKFSLADRQVPIRVSLRESSREDLATIENLPVPTTMGTTVPLKSVATISFGEGPSTVRRYNQSRRAKIEADLAPGVALGDALKKINALPSLTHLPMGIRNVPVGNAEMMQEMTNNFLLAIGAGVLMVFAVLVLLFARVFQPITILSALPLSLGGAIAALFVARMDFSLSVVIGVLMLMGIVAKNSILLVDFAIEEMRSGKDRLTALVEAGHKRAQPIVMTSIAMIAGMLPTAIGIGDSSEFRAPMAVAVIGGILTSTFLTLVIVPAGFSLVDDIEKWVGPKFQRLITREAGDAAAPVSELAQR